MIAAVHGKSAAPACLYFTPLHALGAARWLPLSTRAQRSRAAAAPRLQVSDSFRGPAPRGRPLSKEKTTRNAFESSKVGRRVVAYYTFAFNLNYSFARCVAHLMAVDGKFSGRGSAQRSCWWPRPRWRSLSRSTPTSIASITTGWRSSASSRCAPPPVHSSPSARCPYIQNEHGMRTT